MLVACILVNRCTWEVAEPVHRRLRVLFTIRSLAAIADDPDALRFLASVVRPLGFQNVRSRKIAALAAAWLRRRPRTAEDVLRLPGCGRYAADSWAIFVDGRTDVRPTDGKLNWHLARLRETARRQRGTMQSSQRKRAESIDGEGDDRV